MAAALRNADGSRAPLPPELDVAARDVAEVNAAVDRWFAEQDALFSSSQFVGLGLSSHVDASEMRRQYLDPGLLPRRLCPDQ
jgi:hypothetical protein